MRVTEAWLKTYQEKRLRPPGKKTGRVPVITAAQARYYATEAAAWQVYEQAEDAAWRAYVEEEGTA